jgi:hypothetical protein
MEGSGLIDRRKYKRFRVEERAFAVFGSRVWQLGKILDISRAGLAFRYISHADRSNGSSELLIYLADKGFRLEKVPFETVWDSELSDQLPSASITMRCRGVQFTELTQDQRAQLGNFIRNHTSVRDMRTSPGDRRQIYSLRYFRDGGVERRRGKERRSQSNAT